MSQTEKYQKLLQAIIRKQENLLGEKVAEGKARSAPLEIDPEGQIHDYYGKGENAVEILITQYEDVWGKEPADKKIKRIVKKELRPQDYEMVPERIRPEEKEKKQVSSPFNRIKNVFS